MSKLKFISAILGISLILSSGVIAAQQSASSNISVNESIQATDLGVNKPTILPDNPIYFLKNWARGIQLFFTFNPVAKMELRNKFSSERLLELEEMINKKKNPKIIEKATESYQKEIDKTSSIADKIKGKERNNPKIRSFLEKYTKQQLLQQRILEKLENQVPSQALKKIKETREKHLDRFKDVMMKLEDKNKIPATIENGLKKIKGGKFREFRDAETLENIERKFPKDIKQKIDKRKEEIIKNLRNELVNMSPKDESKMSEYLRRIKGNKLAQLKILDDLQKQDLPDRLSKKIKDIENEKIKDIGKEYQGISADNAQAQINKAQNEINKVKESTTTIKSTIYRGKAVLRLIKLAEEHLKEAKIAMAQKKYGKAYGLSVAAYNEARNSIAIIERIKLMKSSPKKIKEEFERLYPGAHLPSDVTKCEIPEPPICINGKVVTEKDKNGCPVFKCVVPTSLKKSGENIPKENKKESSMTRINCPTVWQPVCGKNGKTYSNKCVAEKIAKTEIAHMGICETKESDFVPPKTPTTTTVPGIKIHVPNPTF